MANAVVLCLAIVVCAGLAGFSPSAAQAPRDTAPRGTTKPAQVNLNTATQQELETLRGIGPATARRIIANRPYASVAELSRARVAGPIIEMISPKVTVGTGAATRAPVPNRTDGSGGRTVRAGDRASQDGATTE